MWNSRITTTLFIYIPSECDLALGYLADVNDISLANEIYSSLAGWLLTINWWDLAKVDKI